MSSARDASSQCLPRHRHQQAKQKSVFKHQAACSPPAEQIELSIPAQIAAQNFLGWVVNQRPPPHHRERPARVVVKSFTTFGSAATVFRASTEIIPVQSSRLRKIGSPPTIVSGAAVVWSSERWFCHGAWSARSSSRRLASYSKKAIPLKKTCKASSDLQQTKPPAATACCHQPPFHRLILNCSRCRSPGQSGSMGVRPRYR